MEIWYEFQYPDVVRQITEYQKRGEMMYRNLDYRMVDKILRANGYKVERMGSTNHVIYSKGNRTISIPSRGRGRDVNAMLIRRLFKDNNIRF